MTPFCMEENFTVGKCNLFFCPIYTNSSETNIII
jgi:hypothetical protein